jgi:hypothetical protein
LINQLAVISANTHLLELNLSFLNFPLMDSSL